MATTTTTTTRRHSQQFDAVVACVGRFNRAHAIVPAWAELSADADVVLPSSPLSHTTPSMPSTAATDTTLPPMSARSTPSLLTIHISDLRREHCAGRDLVIVGGGAFSVEAVDTCLHRYAARSVTLVARSMHPVLPRAWFESPTLTRLFWALAAGWANARTRRLAAVAGAVAAHTLLNRFPHCRMRTRLLL
jgi:cation diffusion facilitator CzcD-associated flavoprotein CzcO